MPFIAKIKNPIAIGIAANAGLLIGNFASYWDFSTTLITYVYEVLIFAVIQGIYLFKDERSSNLGTFLVSGFFIIAIPFFVTISIGESIGELTFARNFAKSFMLNIFIQIQHIWPIILIRTISGIIEFLDTPKSSRELNLQTTLFYKIFLIAGIILLCSLVVFLFGVKSKLPILIIAIAVRVGIDYYVYPQEFKNLFKQNSTDK